MKRKHYYGYASEIDKRFSSSEVSWVLDREGEGCSGVREQVEVVRVFEEL
jgi:hypothetical protein